MAENLKAPFLAEIMRLNTSLLTVLHNRIMLLNGISGLILGFVLSQVSSFEKYAVFTKIGWAIIFFSLLLVIIINIMTLKSERRTDVKENIFFYDYFLRSFSRDKYIKKLQNIKTENEIAKACAEEIYDLGINLKSKFSKVKLAVIVFISGLVLGGLFIILGFFS